MSDDYIPPNHNILGSCSLCGGPVVSPTIWMATIPPPIFCAHCGAVRKASYGPEIPMVKPAKGER